MNKTRNITERIDYSDVILVDNPESIQLVASISLLC